MTLCSLRVLIGCQRFRGSSSGSDSDPDDDDGRYSCGVDIQSELFLKASVQSDLQPSTRSVSVSVQTVATANT